jgi:hypothetical protein
MEFADGNGLVNLAAGADLFAGVVAHPATYGREGVIFSKEFECLCVLTGVDQSDIALDTDMGRASGLAGRYTAFGNTIGARNGLSILLINGFAGIQALVVFVWYIDRANLGTIATAGAFVKIHKTRILTQFSGKVSRSSFQGEKFGVREEFDI